MKRLLIYGIIAATAALTAGCSAEREGEPDPGPSRPEPFWLSFSVGNIEGSKGDSQAGNATSPTYASAKTRAIDNSITTLCAYLIDDNGKVVAAGTASGEDITPTEKGAKAVVSMLDARKIARGTRYRLRVVANLPGSTYTSLIANGFSSISDADMTYTYPLERYEGAEITDMTAAQLPEEGMPMSTAPADEVEVTVPDNGKEYSTKDTAYEVDPESSGKKIINLTRILARIDFKSTAAATEKGIPATNTYTLPDGRFNLEVKALSPVNMASVCYMVPRISDGIAECPSPVFKARTGATLPLTVGARRIVTGMSTTDYTEIEYAAEYMPPKQGVALNSTTGVIVTALLRVNANSPQDVKEAFADPEHPSLWYFDDGKYQGIPRAAKPEAVTANWHEIKYDSTLEGYPLYYVKSIRHKSEGTSATDGVISDGEYGIIRNTAYQITINSFTLLPHPWNPTDTPEQGDEGISITVTVPARWNYHRQVLELGN